MRILFLLKQKSSSGGDGYSILESGLLNSARMTMNALVKELNVDADLKIVVDGNSIDRELHLFKPDIAIIEAVWVTPTKLRELRVRHPNVYFVIRIHSEIPFLANEGVSLDWIMDYATIHNVFVAFNSSRTAEDFNVITSDKYFYLPNIYEDIDKPDFDLFDLIRGRRRKIPGVIDIGCFGALRPMKNQLEQAVAALYLAAKHDIQLFFHINATRLEQGGQSVLKNLRALFDRSKHTLVEHPWMDREDFLELIKAMDCGMQVSFNESFNIVTADFIKVGIPIVVSRSIEWMPDIVKVSTESTKDIVRGLEFIITNPKPVVKLSGRYLEDYNERAVRAWRKFLYD